MNIGVNSAGTFRFAQCPGTPQTHVWCWVAWVCASSDTVHTTFTPVQVLQCNLGVNKPVSTNITNQPDQPHTSPMSPAQPLMHRLVAWHARTPRHIGTSARCAQSSSLSGPGAASLKCSVSFFRHAG